MTLISIVAIFLAGAIGWDAVVHASFFLSKSEPKSMGIKWTSAKNKVAAAINVILAIALLYVGLFSGW